MLGGHTRVGRALTGERAGTSDTAHRSPPGSAATAAAAAAATAAAAKPASAHLPPRRSLLLDRIWIEQRRKEKGDESVDLVRKIEQLLHEGPLLDHLPIPKVRHDRP